MKGRVETKGSAVMKSRRKSGGRNIWDEGGYTIGDQVVLAQKLQHHFIL